MADNKKSSEKSEELCLVCVLLGMFCDSLDYYYIIEWYIGRRKDREGVMKN
jgi:hypothetical protein